MLQGNQLPVQKNIYTVFISFYCVVVKRSKLDRQKKRIDNQGWYTQVKCLH